MRVFMNGGKCGDLCFRNEEFQYLKAKKQVIEFIPDIPTGARLATHEIEPEVL